MEILFSTLKNILLTIAVLIVLVLTFMFTILLFSGFRYNAGEYYVVIGPHIASIMVIVNQIRCRILNKRGDYIGVKKTACYCLILTILIGIVGLCCSFVQAENILNASALLFAFYYIPYFLKKKE